MLLPKSVPLDKASALSTTVYASVSFIVPEIISIPPETLDKYLKNSNDLKLYNQYPQYQEALKVDFENRKSFIMKLTNPKNLFTNGVHK